MLGQVVTPRAIADWMVREAICRGPLRLLDPCLGQGVFLDALQAQLDGRPLNSAPRVSAFEIDKQIKLKARQSWPALAVSVSRRDFLTANVRNRFDACVANPPYVRHHDMAYANKVWHRFDEQVGERISRNTNMYALFMLRIWSLLAPGGRAVVITPLEWLNADFGCALKRYFVNQNALDALVLFDDASTVFGDALTTAGITILRRDRKPQEPIRIATIADGRELTAETLRDARHARGQDLDPMMKWTNALRDANIGLLPTGLFARSCAQLQSIATCSRGIATGANDYFTLTEKQRIAHRIDRHDLTPCITRASDLAAGVFDNQVWSRLVKADKRVWLLTPRETCDEALECYLEIGRQRGIPERHLPSHRPVWFRPERRPAAPILISVFFRDRPRVVLNRAQALNLTAYHGIYPSLEPRDDDHIGELFEWLNSDAATDALLAQSRIYGGGLRKLEPRDVMAVRIPSRLVR